MSSIERPFFPNGQMTKNEINNRNERNEYERRLKTYPKIRTWRLCKSATLRTIQQVRSHIRSKSWFSVPMDCLVCQTHPTKLQSWSNDCINMRFVIVFRWLSNNHELTKNQLEKENTSKKNRTLFSPYSLKKNTRTKKRINIWWTMRSLNHDAV